MLASLAQVPVPLCVMVIGFPAMFRVGEGCEKLFDPAKIVIVADPDPLALLEMLSHGAFGMADQLQPKGSIRLRLRIPPLESKAKVRGLITGSWQEPTS